MRGEGALMQTRACEGATRGGARERFPGWVWVRSGPGAIAASAEHGCNPASAGAVSPGADVARSSGGCGFG